MYYYEVNNNYSWNNNFLSYKLETHSYVNNKGDGTGGARGQLPPNFLNSTMALYIYSARPLPPT